MHEPSQMDRVRSFYSLLLGLTLLPDLLRYQLRMQSLHSDGSIRVVETEL